jgi:RimJ/RimL family protein N-acetyltransferase
MVKYSPMSMRITTSRLALRPWDPADAADYQALVAERGDGVPALEDIRSNITLQLARADESGIALLVVTRLVENDFIGYCGLIVGRTNLDEPEIAYELQSRVHNRGYATEAAGAVLRAAAETGRQRLWSTVGAWNAPSLRVLDKLGFERDRVSDETVGRVVWLTRSLA